MPLGCLGARLHMRGARETPMSSDPPPSMAGVGGFPRDAAKGQAAGHAEIAARPRKLEVEAAE